jgi:hypothetical protein
LQNAARHSLGCQLADIGVDFWPDQGDAMALKPNHDQALCETQFDQNKRGIRA